MAWLTPLPQAIVGFMAVPLFWKRDFVPTITLLHGEGYPRSQHRVNNTAQVSSVLVLTGAATALARYRASVADGESKQKKDGKQVWREGAILMLVYSSRHLKQRGACPGRWPTSSWRQGGTCPGTH